MVKKGTQKKKNIKRSSLKRRSVQHGGESFSYHNLTMGSKMKQTDATTEKIKYVSSMLLDIFEGKTSATSIADRFLKFARGKTSFGITKTLGMADRDTREPSEVFTQIILPVILSPFDIDMKYSNMTFSQVMLSKFLSANVTKISVLQGAILKGNTELVRIIMDTARNWGATKTVDINTALDMDIPHSNYTSAKDLIYTSGLVQSRITVSKEIPVPSVDGLNEMGKILYGDFPEKVLGNAGVGVTFLQKYNAISATRNKEMGLNSYINLVKNTGDDTTIDTATYSIIFQYTQPPPYIEKLNKLLDTFTVQSTETHAIDITNAAVNFGKIDIANVNNYFIGNIKRITDASTMVSKQKAKMEELNPGDATHVETLTRKGIELKNNIAQAYQSIIDFLNNILKYNERANIQANIDGIDKAISRNKMIQINQRRMELTAKINALTISDAGAVELEQLRTELANLPPATDVLEQQKQDLQKMLAALDGPITGQTQEYSAFIQHVGANVEDNINDFIAYITAKKDDNFQVNSNIDSALQTSPTIAQALNTVTENKTAIDANKTDLEEQTNKDVNRGDFQKLSQLYTLTVKTLSEYMEFVEEFDKTPQMTTLIEKTHTESSITDPPSPIDSSLNETGDGTASTSGPGSSKENPLQIKPGKPFFIELDGAKYMITPE
jgi:hypothetical protein